tara:strand:- start:6 stop:467 length:462 start_codon:yes stop_codon:yes gene_type:complete
VEGAVANVYQWLLRHGWLILIILAVAYEGNRRWQYRSVMDFSQSESTYTPAAPGDVGNLTFSMLKTRDPCRLQPDTLHLILRDGEGNGFRINQHSGVKRDAPVGLLDRSIDFEVPRFARPGDSTVAVAGQFLCTRAIIYERTPDFPFEVLDGD